MDPTQTLLQLGAISENVSDRPELSIVQQCSFRNNIALVSHGRANEVHACATPTPGMRHALVQGQWEGHLVA